MAAKKAKGDDWFSSLDAELEKKTREIIEDVGEQNVARLELNKTLIEDFWKVWKRINRCNVHSALEPSYTNWAVFPDTFPDGDWHWRPGFNPAAVQTVQLLDRSMDQGRVGDALKVNYVEVDGKVHLRVTFEYSEGEHYYKYSGWKRSWTIHTLYDQPLDKTNMDDLHRLFADLVRVWYESHLRRAPPHPQDASPPRPELGMPPLRGHQRSGADGLLVLRGGDRPPRRASLGRADRGDVAVPQMPRLEQRLPPILLVVRDHPGEGAEAGCVTRPSGCRGTIRHRSG